MSQWVSEGLKEVGINCKLINDNVYACSLPIVSLVLMGISYPSISHASPHSLGSNKVANGVTL
jgi:hypothetical protein